MGAIRQSKSNLFIFFSMNSKSEKENQEKSTDKKEITENAQKSEKLEESKIKENPQKPEKTKNPGKVEKHDEDEKPKSIQTNEKNEKKLFRKNLAVKMVNKELKGVNTSKEKIDESSKENTLMTHWSKSRRHSSFGENRTRRDRKASVDLWLMVKDAQLLQEKARRKKIEDEEKAKSTKKLKKNLTYEDWVKSKSADRRASATPIYNFDRRGSTTSSLGTARRESLPI